MHRPFLNSSRRRPTAVGPVIPGGRSARTGTTPRPSHRSTRIHPDPRPLPSPIPPSIAERCFSSFSLLPFFSFRSPFPSNPSPFSKPCPLASSFPPSFFLIIPPFLFVSLLAGTSPALQIIFHSSLVLFFFSFPSYFDKYFKKKNFVDVDAISSPLCSLFPPSKLDLLLHVVFLRCVVDASNVVVVTFEFCCFYQNYRSLAPFYLNKNWFLQKFVRGIDLLKLHRHIYPSLRKLLHSGNIARYKY